MAHQNQRTPLWRVTDAAGVHHPVWSYSELWRRVHHGGAITGGHRYPEHLTFDMDTVNRIAAVEQFKLHRTIPSGWAGER